MFRLSVSPATAPSTVPFTVAPVAAVVPSYTLVKVPPMLAVAVSDLALIEALTSAITGGVKL